MSDEVIEQVERQDGSFAGLFAWCEGCDSRHYIPVIPLVLNDGQFQASWDWNQDMVKPTFNPSILIYEAPGHHPRCHSYIREGVWEYLGDCTHNLVNMTRPLLKRDDWPEETWPNN